MKLQTGRCLAVLILCMIGIDYVQSVSAKITDARFMKHLSPTNALAQVDAAIESAQAKEVADVSGVIGNILEVVSGQLETIEKFKNLAGNFAKLAGLFGVLGGVLSFASGLFGGDPVMEKLDKIQQSIQQLQTSMDAGFEKLSGEIESQSCRQSLTQYLNTIDNAADSVQNGDVNGAQFAIDLPNLGNAINFILNSLNWVPG